MRTILRGIDPDKPQGVAEWFIRSPGHVNVIDHKRPGLYYGFLVNITRRMQHIVEQAFTSCCIWYSNSIGVMHVITKLKFNVVELSNTE